MDPEVTQTQEVAPLLNVKGLRKSYIQARSVLQKRFAVPAVDGVDLWVGRGSIVGLVGRSGSGKSTLARCIAGLETPTSGEIWFAGKNLAKLGDSELRLLRPAIQLIFQDAATALNPRLSAVEIVVEPLRIQRRGVAGEQIQRALETMEQVGLSLHWANTLPSHFSGGQRQRLAIARALVLSPQLLVLDEALTGLDLSLQAQILNLLLELQARYGLTYLFISHDLQVVAQIADEVAVMDAGRIVERARTAELFRYPSHSCTRALLAAVPGSGWRELAAKGERECGT
jgi:ABC-type glutathione transport system ATPase component